MPFRYTAEEVDVLCEQFEKAAQRQCANKNSAVRLRAAEADVLKSAEKTRDLMEKAVKDTSAESRELLKTVFGSNLCERFKRFAAVIETVEFSDMYKGDQRWGHLQSIIKTIEEILDQLGMFKPWMLTAAPEGLSYKGVRGRFSPGEKVKLSAALTGGENITFSIEPPLPEGLELDRNTGEIGGVISPTEERPMEDYTITAKNAAGEATSVVSFAVQVPPPHSLEYPFVTDVFTGEAIYCEAVIEGGAVKEWSIEPQLPRGLALNQQSGAIEGTPLDAADTKEYTVTASNGGGEVKAEVKFAVHVAPPVEISYPGALRAYPMGAVIRLEPEVVLQSGEKFEAPQERRVSTTSEAPPTGSMRVRSTTDFTKGPPTGSMRSRSSTSVSGPPTASMLKRQATIDMPKMEFAIEPELPEGLTLVMSTGVITGMPKAATAEKTYKVTVSNPSGKVSVDLPLAILLIPPTDLAYPEVAEEFFTGDPVALTPVVEGLVDSWSVEPALPAGLHLDTKMGTIGGIPTVACPPGAWTVKAKNGVGEVSTTVQFAVRDAPPTNLDYPDLLPLYPVLRKMNTTATVLGLITEFSIEPALPAGMSIDARTGEISGIPAGPADETDYVVSAKNDTGACTTTLHFEVRVMPPAELSYPHLDDLYEVGETVDLEPEVEGGAETWAIEPELPSGLSFDVDTGRISGAPTMPADETSYVVTASNEAGGTSTVLTFGITAPPPAGLTYPEAGDDYVVGGEDVVLEPEMEQGVCCTFSVSPPLPGGLVLDTATGIISGSPTEPVETATYTVTATNVAGSTSVDVPFSCSEIVEDQVDQDFASMIEGVTDLAALVDMKMDKTRTMADWMVWMVHRAHLNDPTLTDFNFNNMQMPLPHLEPRVSPKLMRALERNTYITNLQLCNSNMQKPDGHILADSLKKNKTLQHLNIESNNCDSVSIQAVAVALKENEESVLETLKFNNQKNVGEYFGRPLEMAMAELVETDHKITKLGFSCNDPHWRLVIERNILRNVDYARRKRKRGKTAHDDVIPAEEKSLSRVTLSEVPESAVWEIFEDDNEQLKLARALTAKSKRLPTKEQLQANAKAAGKPLKYAEVAPLVSSFRKKLFDSAKHSEIIAVDAYGVEEKGVMRDWTEKNENWSLDVWPDDDRRLNFKMNKTPIVEISEEFAEWLSPGDA